MEEEILKRIDQLADFIQAKSPLVWEVFCKQQITEGIVSAIFLALSIPFLLFALHVLKTKPEWAKDGFGDNLGGTALIAISGTITLVAAIIFLCMGLLRLLNPEYYAIMTLRP